MSYRGRRKGKARVRERVKVETLYKAMNIIALIMLIITLIVAVMFILSIPWNKMLKM